MLDKVENTARFLPAKPLKVHRTVWINTPMARDLRAPFGGYKMSGIGRDGLPGSIELFTEQKTVMIPQDKIIMPKLGSIK